MDPITIVEQEETHGGWRFVVDVGRDDIEDDIITYNVNVDQDYYEYLTKDSEATPEDLVQKTFEFLLSRESKESIMRDFDLDVVGNYYDDYELEIVKMLNKSGE